MVSFQDGHEERSAAPDDGFDDMNEESFEDEEPPPMWDRSYESDNAGDPDDEEVDSIVYLVELMCRAVYTPLNSSISRVCGRFCSGPGSCQRRVPAPMSSCLLSISSGVRREPATRWMMRETETWRT
jgi:hypothetical protein